MSDRATFAMRDGKRIAVMRPTHPELAVKAGAFASFANDARLFYELPKEPGPYTFVGWLSVGAAGAVLNYQAVAIGRIQPGDSFCGLAYEGKEPPAIGGAFP